MHLSKRIYWIILPGERLLLLYYVRPREKNCVFGLTRPTLFSGPTLFFFFFLNVTCHGQFSCVCAATRVRVCASGSRIPRSVVESTVCMYMYFEEHDTTTGACARACSHAVDLHSGVCMQIVKDCTEVSTLHTRCM